MFSKVSTVNCITAKIRKMANRLLKEKNKINEPARFTLKLTKFKLWGVLHTQAPSKPRGRGPGLFVFAVLVPHNAHASGPIKP